MRLINRLKRILPPEFRQSLKRGIFEQHDMLARLQNLKHAGFAPAAAIDIGAFEGSWTLECRRIWPDVQILMVEPLPDKRDKLQAVGRNLECGPVISCAVSDHEGQVHFHTAETNSGISALNDVGAETITVPCRTLDSIVSQTGIVPNLIKIDVQGHELHVLRGGKKSMSAAQVIILEVSIIQIGEVPAFREVDRFMEAAGFRLYDIIPQYYRPLDGALWQADAFYVAESSSLVASSSWA
jgi:FkbM family methyltransferase